MQYSLPGSVFLDVPGNERFDPDYQVINKKHKPDARDPGTANIEHDAPENQNPEKNGESRRVGGRGISGLWALGSRL
jgi:hypothetical protein